MVRRGLLVCPQCVWQFFDRILSLPAFILQVHCLSTHVAQQRVNPLAVLLCPSMHLPFHRTPLYDHYAQALQFWRTLPRIAWGVAVIFLRLPTASMLPVTRVLGREMVGRYHPCSRFPSCTVTTAAAAAPCFGMSSTAAAAASMCRLLLWRPGLASAWYSGAANSGVSAARHLQTRVLALRGVRRPVGVVAGVQGW